MCHALDNGEWNVTLLFLLIEFVLQELIVQRCHTNPLWRDIFVQTNAHNILCIFNEIYGIFHCCHSLQWPHMHGRYGVSNHRHVLSNHRRKTKIFKAPCNMSFVKGNHWLTVDSTHKGTVVQKVSLYHDLTMISLYLLLPWPVHVASTMLLMLFLPLAWFLWYRFMSPIHYRNCRINS